MTKESSSPKVPLENAKQSWNYIVELLRERGFTVNLRNPLSKGVYRDIRNVLSSEDISSNKLHDAIGFHVNSIKYLTRMREGVERYNIRGEVSGKVTKDEQKHAFLQLKKIHPTFKKLNKKTTKKSKPSETQTKIRHKKTRQVQPTFA